MPGRVVGAGCPGSATPYAVGLWWLFGTPTAYVAARTGPGRHRGRIGMGFALAALAAFVVLVFVAG